MKERRRDIGLHVVKNGSATTHMPKDWQKFVQDVTDAALKQKPPQRKNKRKGVSVDRSAFLWSQPMPDEKRCQHIWAKGERKGKQCSRYAMKGANRCPSHGGYRQNPQHPATIRRLDDILTIDALRAEKGAHNEQNPQHVNIIHEYLSNEGLPLSPINIHEGVQAYETNDNGKAFRRWQKFVKLTTEKTGQNARKEKLRARRKNE